MNNIELYIDEVGREPEMDELMSFVSYRNRLGKYNEQSYAEKVVNAPITEAEQRQIDLATEQFRQSVQRVDNQILAQYIQAIQNRNYSEAEQILEEAQESPQVNTLMFALLTIGAILLPLYARQRLQALFVQFGLNAIYTRTDSSQDDLRLQAEKGARSHVNTIAKDIKKLLDESINEQITNAEVEAAVKERFEELAALNSKDYVQAVLGDQEIYAYAREQILSGVTKDQVMRSLQDKFSTVGKRRANVIASNEANRVFTMSQFDADQQFLAQNDLTSKAYKRLVSNTGHPEPICKAIIEATRVKPIPFNSDFLPFGKTFTVKDSGKTYKFKPTYEKLKSGHIHVNCHCRYELLIKQDNGTFLNTYDFKVMNDADFDERKHKRDRKGRFAKKASTSSIDIGDLDNVKAFDKYVEDAYWSGKHGHYDEDTTDAVRAYQGRYYDAINIQARANYLDQPLTIFDKDTTYGEVIDDINRAGNITLAEDTVLYRGTEIPVHQNVNEGETIYSRSFLSTSADKKIAEKFRYEGGSMLVIMAKKGQKVIIPDLVTFGKRGKTLGEAEVLGQSGSRLKVIKIKGDTVYAELN